MKSEEIVTVEETALGKLEANVLGNIHDIKNWLFSAMMDLTDAIARDEVQRKALKEQVRKGIWDKEYYSENIMWNFNQFAKAKGLKFYPDKTQDDKSVPAQNPYEGIE